MASEKSKLKAQAKKKPKTTTKSKKEPKREKKTRKDKTESKTKKQKTKAKPKKTKSAETKKPEKPSKKQKNEDKKKKTTKSKPESEGKKKKKTADAVPESGETAQKDSEKEGEKGKEQIKKIKRPVPVEKIKYTAKPSTQDKKKTPRFRRQEHGTRKKLDDKWRRPRGIDSKQRVYKRGKGALPAIGYKNPQKTAGRVNGYLPKLVHNPKDLEGLDPKNQAIIIASRVGRRKRNQIIVEANQQKIIVLNPKAKEI
ncbi:MAG: hypothetical protein GF334_03885 [Candidatus Altiarchaeales archaeon]|nr:hypothetical protein [Candidatus Altiarchaeales archaeon]